MNDNSTHHILPSRKSNRLLLLRLGVQTLAHSAWSYPAIHSIGSIVLVVCLRAVTQRLLCGVAVQSPPIGDDALLMQFIVAVGIAVAVAVCYVFVLRRLYLWLISAELNRLSLGDPWSLEGTAAFSANVALVCFVLAHGWLVFVSIGWVVLVSLAVLARPQTISMQLEIDRYRPGLGDPQRITHSRTVWQQRQVPLGNMLLAVLTFRAVPQFGDLYTSFSSRVVAAAPEAVGSICGIFMNGFRAHASAALLFLLTGAVFLGIALALHQSLRLTCNALVLSAVSRDQGREFESLYQLFLVTTLNLTMIGAFSSHAISHVSCVAAMALIVLTRLISSPSRTESYLSNLRKIF